MPPESIGKYKVTGRLGEGAMGEVFLGEDSLIGRPVAIKVMKTTRPEDKERFLQEARTVGALSHPGIVVLHDAGFIDERPYLVMEYVPGRNLEAWLREPHHLAEHLQIIEDLCRALDYAHDHGVLHRDLKPSNIQVMPNGHCKLMDFGIARTDTGNLTTSHTVLGTPGYMAPEILEDAIYSRRADVYSAGLVAYEMLAGINPYAGKTVASTFMNVLNARAPHLILQRPELPSELSHAIMACLARDPHERPADLSRLASVVRRTRASGMAGVNQTLSGRNPLAVATHSLRGLRPASLRQRRIWTMAGGVAAAALLALTAHVAHRWGVLVGEQSEAQRSATLPSAAPPPAATLSSAPASPTAPAPTPSAPPARVVLAPATTPRPRATPGVSGSKPTGPTAAAATPPLAAPPAVGPAARAIPADDDVSPAPAATAVPIGPALVPLSDPPREPVARLLEVAPGRMPRRATAVLDLRGVGLRADHRVRVLRGQQEAAGIRVVRQQLQDAGLLRVTLLVDSDVAPGLYSLTLIDARARPTNSLSFEVTL